MIVMDASAAILGLLNNGETRSMLQQSAVVCPHLADSEVTHALRSQVIRGVLDVGDAWRAIDTWGRLGIERIGVRGLLPRVWELRENLSAYDATYIALAEALEAPLVTADSRLARARGPRCPITVVPG